MTDFKSKPGARGGNASNRFPGVSGSSQVPPAAKPAPTPVKGPGKERPPR